MTSLLAQAGLAATVGSWGLAIIIIAAIIGVVLVILQVTNVQVPDWLRKILIIVFAAAVGILAILFLVRLAGGGGGVW